MIYNAGVALKAKQQQLAEKQLDMENDPSRVFLKSLSSSAGQGIASTLGQMAVGAAKYKLFGGERLQVEGERSNRAQEKGAKETRVETGRHNIVTETEAERAARAREGLTGQQITETGRANLAQEGHAVSKLGKEKVDGIVKQYQGTFDTKMKQIGLLGSAESMDAFQKVLEGAAKNFKSQEEMDYFMGSVAPLVTDMKSFRRMAANANDVVGAGGRVFSVSGKPYASPKDLSGQAKKGTQLVDNLMQQQSALKQMKAELHESGMALGSVYNSSTRKLDEQAMGDLFKGKPSGAIPDGSKGEETFVSSAPDKAVTKWMGLRDRFNAAREKFSKGIEMVQKEVPVLPFVASQGNDGLWSISEGDTEQDKTERQATRQRANIVDQLRTNNFGLLKAELLAMSDDELRMIVPNWNGEATADSKGTLKVDSNPNSATYKKKVIPVTKAMLIDDIVAGFPTRAPSAQQNLIDILQARQSAVRKASGISPTPNRKLPAVPENRIDKALRDTSKFSSMVRSRLSINGLQEDGVDPISGETYGNILRKEYSLNPDSARNDMHFVLSGTSMGPTPEERNSFLNKNVQTYLNRIVDNQANDAQRADKLVEDGVPREKVPDVMKVMRSGEGSSKTVRLLYNAMQSRNRRENIFEFGTFGQKDQEIDTFKANNPRLNSISPKALRAALSSSNFRVGQTLTGPQIEFVLANLKPE